MSRASTPEGTSIKETLRVALDADAARAFMEMSERLKAANAFVKIQPSQFVSFLVSDFLHSYFEKDLDVLVAEFFDSQSFYENATQKSRGDKNFEDVMDAALTAVKKIKSKRRRRAPLKRSESSTALDSAQ